MKFSSTLAVLLGVFVGFSIANPLPEADAAVEIDNPLERRCTANYSE